MALDPNQIQMQALRMKNAGDPRPIPQIVQQLMQSAEAAPPAPIEAPVQEVTPTPATPVPVGEPVAVRPAVPPMSTPFNPVDRAREAAAPQAGNPVAAVSATDAAVENAQQRGAPESDYLTRAREAIRSSRQAELDEIRAIREQIGVDPREEEILSRREDRLAKQEASIAEDEKLQAWNALAMAGFKMAQSASPYFAAALSEGLQAGLEGYNASKAAAAEKKARLEDARDTIGLERIASERRAEGEAMSDRDRADAVALRELQAQAAALDMQIKAEREPLVRREMQLQLQNIQSQISDRSARLGLAYRADARAAAAARGGGGDAFARAYQSGISSEAEYGRKYAEKAMEMSDLRPGDPGYAQQFQAAVSEGRTVYRNSNPQWSGIANKVEGVQTLARPKGAAIPAPVKREEDSWWSRLNPFD